uniref:Uncharacterized protein n=1 Tax=Conchiformibius kuhniae TaxID=211502 RepID=A0A8T9N0A8_9NEIS|nr:hypothetical protein LVJ77_04595 [Conchiformibius kuhniae]
MAFATLNRKSRPTEHMILTDCLILDFDEVAVWLAAHGGKTVAAHYQTACTACGMRTLCRRLCNGCRIFALARRAPRFDCLLARCAV